MQNRSGRPDRRVVKTKKAIRGAFARLVSQKEPDSITVTELAEAADINRKTFYNYYSDIGQIVDEIEEELAAAVENALQDIDLQGVLKDPYQLLARLTDTISADLELYTCIFRDEHSAGLIDKLLARIRDKLRAACGGRVDEEQGLLDMAIDYALAGTAEVYQKWLHSDRSIPLETVSKWVSRLASAGLSDLLRT